jgi:hypothetical protein
MFETYSNLVSMLTVRAIDLLKALNNNQRPLEVAHTLALGIFCCKKLSSIGFNQKKKPF